MGFNALPHGNGTSMIIRVFISVIGFICTYKKRADVQPDHEEKTHNFYDIQLKYTT